MQKYECPVKSGKKVEKKKVLMLRLYIQPIKVITTSATQGNNIDKIQSNKQTNRKKEKDKKKTIGSRFSSTVMPE